MAAAPVKVKLFSWRYLMAKVMHAGVEGMYQFASARAPGVAHQASLSEAFAAASSKFRSAYEQRLTTVMYMAGAAMAPTLNKRALDDPSEVEKLVVRLLPRPTSSNVLVGDVVAFNSPIALPEAAAQSVMVRRVAALEGAAMVSEDAEDEAFSVPKDHFWALGDNEALSPPNIIDSRTIGCVPLRNIIGRVIYSASTSSDHAPVANHPHSVLKDMPIVEHEVDAERLWPAGLGGAAGRGPESGTGSTDSGGDHKA